MAKILVVASLASSLVRFRGKLIESLRSHGHDVVACAPYLPDDDPTVAILTGMGVRIANTPLERTGLNPLADFRYLKALVSILRSERPQLVFAYTAKPVIYSGLATRLVRGAHVALISGLGYGFGSDSLKQRLLARILTNLFRVSLRRSARVIFQNADDRAVFLERTIVRNYQCALVSGSGVDTHQFQLAPTPSEPVFLLMARMIPEKGVREYVQAARVVKLSNPKARFLLAGWIEERTGAIAREEVEAWSNEGLVEYLGALEDVRPSIMSASIYVLPSYYGEGVPRSILEAMSMGRAIITTDMPGCRETVSEGENGFLVPPRDPATLAQRMEQLARDPALVARMGERSRRLAEERFAIDHVNRDMLRIMGVAA